MDEDRNENQVKSAKKENTEISIIEIGKGTLLVSPKHKAYGLLLEDTLLNQNNSFNLQVERIIASAASTEVVFVALYSPGVRIQDMIVEDDSVFSGVYSAGIPHMAWEQTIESIRTKFPGELQQLQTLAYSKPFQINDKVTVTMPCTLTGGNTKFSDGKIAWENMMTILDTCRKQDVSFMDYVKDIFSKRYDMPRLSTCILEKAKGSHASY